MRRRPLQSVLAKVPASWRLSPPGSLKERLLCTYCAQAPGSRAQLPAEALPAQLGCRWLPPAASLATEN